MRVGACFSASCLGLMFVFRGGESVVLALRQPRSPEDGRSLLLSFSFQPPLLVIFLLIVGGLVLLYVHPTRSNIGGLIILTLPLCFILVLCVRRFVAASLRRTRTPQLRWTSSSSPPPSSSVPAVPDPLDIW